MSVTHIEISIRKGRAIIFWSLLAHITAGSWVAVEESFAPGQRVPPDTRMKDPIAYLNELYKKRSTAFLILTSY